MGFTSFESAFLRFIYFIVYTADAWYFIGKIWNNYIAETFYFPQQLILWCYTIVNWFPIVLFVLWAMTFLFKETDPYLLLSLLLGFGIKRTNRNDRESTIGIIAVVAFFLGAAYLFYISWQREWLLATFLFPLYILINGSSS